MGLAQRYLLAAGAAALLMPILVLGLNAPVWAGLLGAFATFAALALFAAVRPARAGGRLPAPGADGARAARAALADARPALERLERVCEDLPKSHVRDRLLRIAEATRGVFAEIAAEPRKLAPVQRLLTYYLPRAAAFAEGHRDLRARGMLDTERGRAVDEVLDKLEHAFARFAEELVDFDMAGLDAELRLVEAALKDDLPPQR